MKRLSYLFAMAAIFTLNEATAQWNTIGNNINNTNSGNVGIGNNAPSTLLYVGKNMTEPTITVRNMGGFGGATYTMTDDASGANWKFKATLSGGFKIRDHANLMDVVTIEPNSFANALYIKSTDNIGIGTSSPDNSALLDLNSDSKGFLPPRLTAPQISAITDPADGLIAYCTTDGKFYAYIANSAEWKEISFGSGTIGANCGYAMIINHIAGTIAPVTKTVTYGTVSSIPGETSKCWITSNLGADHQATSVSDNTEAPAGWYWQFNRMQGYKHDGSTRTPNTSWINSISENSNWIAANDPCALELGSSWRIPTGAEWNNVRSSGGWTNWNGPWTSNLKIHVAGFLLNSNGSLFGRGTSSFYWSNSESDITNGVRLFIDITNCSVYNMSKANGNSVRCVRD